VKNSSFDFVLKGRGFKPRRKCHKINSALATEAPPQTAMPLFQPLRFSPGVNNEATSLDQSARNDSLRFGRTQKLKGRESGSMLATRAGT
jgi:hypothetical protein